MQVQTRVNTGSFYQKLATFLSAKIGIFVKMIDFISVFC